MSRSIAGTGLYCLKLFQRGTYGRFQARVQIRQCLCTHAVLAWTILALSFIFVCAVLLLWTPIPEPKIHDEFGYLLAADTFAHGRLAGPALAHPAAFEAPHILVRPAYAAKYPPGQGLVLAAGQRLFGHPYAGVLLSTGALIFLVCWSASLWLPPRWAFAAGLLTWILLFGSYWSSSYWGGSVAACGGAFVLGGLGCVVRRRWRTSGIAFGSGAAILYVTRPYEGGMLCLTVGAIVLYLFLKAAGLERRAMLRGTVIPAAAIVTFVLAPLALWYNYAVTGNPLEIPFVLHERQYGVNSQFWIVEPSSHSTTKAYSNDRLRAIHQWEIDGFLNLRGAWYWKTVYLSGRILGQNVWAQFYGSMFLLFAPWVRLGGRWKWVTLLLATGFLSIFVEAWVFPHYSAPFFAVECIAIMAGGRVLWHRFARSPTGALRLAVPMAIAIFFLAPVAYSGGLRLAAPRNLRAELIRTLQAKDGRHLLLVDYAQEWSIHDEWVYNGYDLQNDPIVFAHFRTDAENRDLVRDFPGRTVWRLSLGPNPDDIRLTQTENPAPVAVR